MMKSKRNSTLFFFICLLFIAGILFGLKLIAFPSKKDQDNLSKVIFGNKVIFVEIAKTPQERQKGLSGREAFDSEHGMLFVFEKEGHYPFWMKDMKFNLDFVFLKGKTVVDLKENIPFPKANEKPELMASQENFDKALEVKAGTIKLLNLQIGDQAEILF